VGNWGLKKYKMGNLIVPVGIVAMWLEDHRLESWH
jgi:hypothetical protein